jgi:DNA-binding transcriptional ArsR family regulator
VSGVHGDADIAAVAEVLDPARTRILMALGDGRALPASAIAAEVGIAPSTASAHLARLLDAGFLSVERHGRHRYYRLSGPEVGELLEALARFAPPAPVRSLKQGTRAEALRFARTCYDHLAGRLGSALMAAMLRDGLLQGGDGTFDTEAARRDRLSAPGGDVDYRLTQRGSDELADFGIALEDLPRRRPLIRYCVDWTEQRHHLAGALGAAIAQRTLDLGWVQRQRAGRALLVTDEGYAGLRERFGVELARP